ncbi:MAG: phosphate ABC transporter permease subunit PstC [Tepidisphaerales bacterium]
MAGTAATSTATGAAGGGDGIRPDLKVRAGRGEAWSDVLLRWLTATAAVTILLMLGALVTVLVVAALPSIQKFGLAFFVTTEWRPNELERMVRDESGRIVRDEDGEPVVEVIPPVFGALPVIYGTAVSSAIALVLAVPLSFGAALFLVRIAPKWLVTPVSFLVEFLAAIPSIAYGIFGMFLLAPWLQSSFQPAMAAWLKDVPGLSWMFYQTLADGQVVEIPSAGHNMLCAGLIIAIMIIPIITAISRDVLASVPRAQVEGTLALGATWWQSCVEMLKYGRSALFGAVMLGLARAAGETMAVAMVIGNKNEISFSPFAPAQTMASLLANEFAEATEIQRGALVEVALILLLMSLTFNVIARYLVVGTDSRSAMAH